MRMLGALLGAAALGLAMPALAQAPAILGPHAALCAPDAAGPAVLVTVTGYKDRKGQTRFELYAARDGEFLTSTKKLIAEGKVFERVDVPTAAEGDMSVCLPVREPGDYAVVVLHDRNASGKLDPFSDGVALSRNPKLRLAKPKAAEVAITVGNEVKPVHVVMNYLSGFRVGPVKR